jgi:RimJ/RimL family protein N-acetyltransferase
MWTYLPYGPFKTYQIYEAWLQSYCTKDEPFFYVITDKIKAIGMASYLRIDPNNGSVEIGHLAYSPTLQRTRMSTEAIFLMINNVFNLGYRRVEWKCNLLNEPSINAAIRLGFRFEGIFRQAAVVKGRNRDTAWYSIIDKEWPELRKRYEHWLEKTNFNDDESQKKHLQDC